MTNVERLLQSYTEQIEVKYLEALRKGWSDSAVIVDVQNQEARRNTVALQRGLTPSAFDAFVGVALSGDRTALAEQLNKRFPNHPAVTALATETPPVGDFPVIIITGKEFCEPAIHFFYRPKPDPPAEELR
jgi:hypothetical protein